MTSFKVGFDSKLLSGIGKIDKIGKKIHSGVGVCS